MDNPVIEGGGPVAPQFSQALSDLLGVSKQLIVQSELHPLLDLIMEKATLLTQSERSTLFLIDDAAGELISYIAQKAGTTQIRLPIGSGIAGHVAKTGETINLRDAYQSDLFDPTWDKHTGFHTRGVLCVPMRNAEGKLTGVIQVLNSKNDAFGDADESILAMFASHAAVAIENLRLHDDLKMVFQSAIRALATAVDQRDPATAGHSERVTLYAIKLGQAAGLGPAVLSALEWAATLHDIGKIGIPDRILTKPAKLTKREQDTMRQHAAATRSILENFAFTGENANIPFIASAHHERLDGSGYPDSLTAESISIPVRILAIADVYDAVTSFDRPYRRAFTPEQGLEVLRKDAGAKLDAELVDLFISQEVHNLERRRMIRIDVDLSMEYFLLPRAHLAPGEGEFAARTGNLSASGLLFVGPDFVPVGTFLDILLHMGDRDIKLMAQSVRIEYIETRKEFEVGIKFLDLPTNSLGLLQKYLVTLHGP